MTPARLRGEVADIAVDMCDAAGCPVEKALVVARVVETFGVSYPHAGRVVNDITRGAHGELPRLTSCSGGRLWPVIAPPWSGSAAAPSVYVPSAAIRRAMQRKPVTP